MKKLLYFLSSFVLGLCVGAASAQTQTLNGYFANSDGSPLNGYFTIGLQGATFKNTCDGSPYQVVPTKKVTYKIVAGQIQGISSASFVSQDCLTPRYPYYVNVSDATNHTLYEDNWYIPRVASGVVDSGEMAAERLGDSPIAVSLPVGIIATPHNSQSVTQPGGTSFTFYGSVIFDGTVTFEYPFTFTTVIATQVLVGGVTSSAYAIDAQGLINASQGYLVGGSGGTLGQCLVSDGTEFVPGTCTPPAFPSLYYQQMSVQGSYASTPQEKILDFNGSLTVTDDPGNFTTHVNLTETGPGNYLASVAAPLSGTGCAQGTGDGGFALQASPCLTATSMVAAIVTGSRALGSVYQNTTGRPMFVKVVYQNDTAGSGQFYAGTTGTFLQQIDACSTPNTGGVTCNTGDFVPPGYYYKATADSPSLYIWTETTF